jgi:hypothetical protein
MLLNYSLDLNKFTIYFNDFSRQYLTSAIMEITNKDSVAAVAQANSEFTKKLYAELVSTINPIK